jgi:hypothetical protein
VTERRKDDKNETGTFSVDTVVFWLLHFKSSICVPILYACIFTVKDVGSMFFQNADTHLPSYMVS